MLSTSTLFGLLVVIITDHCGRSARSLVLAGVVASILPGAIAVATAFDTVVLGEAKLYGIPLSSLDAVFAESLAKRIAPKVKQRDLSFNTSFTSTPILQTRMYPGAYLQPVVGAAQSSAGEASLRWWSPAYVCQNPNYPTVVHALCRSDIGGHSGFEYTCTNENDLNDSEIAGKKCPPNTLFCENRQEKP